MTVCDHITWSICPCDCMCLYDSICPCHIKYMSSDCICLCDGMCLCDYMCPCDCLCLSGLKHVSMWLLVSMRCMCPCTMCVCTMCPLAPCVHAPACAHETIYVNVTACVYVTACVHVTESICPCHCVWITACLHVNLSICLCDCMCLFDSVCPCHIKHMSSDCMHPCDFISLRDYMPVSIRLKACVQVTACVPGTCYWMCPLNLTHFSMSLLVSIVGYIF